MGESFGRKFWAKVLSEFSFLVRNCIGFVSGVLGESFGRVLGESFERVFFFAFGKKAFEALFKLKFWASEGF